jgi:hypothetical protein
MLALVAAIATMSLLVGSAAASGERGGEAQVVAKSSYWRHCGDGYPNYNYFNLKAHNLSCHYAKRVAGHHFRTDDGRFHGWRCHDKMQYESGRSRCQRRHSRYQEIRYVFGV